MNAKNTTFVRIDPLVGSGSRGRIRAMKHWIVSPVWFNPSRTLLSARRREILHCMNSIYYAAAIADTISSLKRGEFYRFLPAIPNAIRIPTTLPISTNTERPVVVVGNVVGSVVGVVAVGTMVVGGIGVGVIGGVPG